MARSLRTEISDFGDVNQNRRILSELGLEPEKALAVRRFSLRDVSFLGDFRLLDAWYGNGGTAKVIEGIDGAVPSGAGALRLCLAELCVAKRGVWW